MYLEDLEISLAHHPTSPYLHNYKAVNAQLEKIARENELYGFASAEGLESNGDFLHFNSPALREFGLRYYEQFKKLEKLDRVFVEKSSPDDAVRTAMEEL